MLSLDGGHPQSQVSWRASFYGANIQQPTTLMIMPIELAIRRVNGRAHTSPWLIFAPPPSEPGRSRALISVRGAAETIKLYFGVAQIHAQLTSIGPQ